MKALSALLVLVSLSLLSRPWIPENLPVKEPLRRLAAEKIRFVYGDGQEVRPEESVEKQSLDGVWRMAELETAEQPFGALKVGEEEKLLPGYADAEWQRVRVPLNWFQMKELRRKFQTAGGQPVVRADVSPSEIVNPYVRGYYRREFVYAPPSGAWRCELEFAGLAHEALIYVNGKCVGGHHGDFVPCRVDITDAVREGKNLLALRVLADLPPTGAGKKVSRTYGCGWNLGAYHGGIWQSVTLRTVRRPLVVERLKLIPEVATGKVTAEVSVWNPLQTAVKARGALGMFLAEAQPQAGRLAEETAEQTLAPGRTLLRLQGRVEGVRLWSGDEPNLYYAGVVLREAGGKVLAACTERFGFREFRSEGRNFYLNGQPVFLFFESAHPVWYGGYDTPNGHANNRDVYTVLRQFKERGYTMLRTAHQPICQEYLDAADELGMMIYDEWGLAFTSSIDEAEFEAENLPELAQWVATDHNHASVVMWSLGNEVPFSKDAALGRQLDKQVQRVRGEDLQKRPICSFAGIADVQGYGREARDTDVLDLHLYTGISEPWTLWPASLRGRIQDCLKTYGKDGELPYPLVISECVGGGWGLYADPRFRSGSVDAYLKQVKRDYTWARPETAGYSGIMPLSYLLDPAKHTRYMQNRLASRILELARLDTTLAGLAPWFAIPDMDEALRWNQRYLPFLQLDADEYPTAPRQLLVPETREVQVGIDNRNGVRLTHPRVRMQLVYEKSGAVTELGMVELPEAPPMATVRKSVKLELPDGIGGQAELRLTALDGERELGRNGYAVTVHRREQVCAPLVEGTMTEMGMLGEVPAELDEYMRSLRLLRTRLKTLADIKDYKVLVLAGEVTLSAQDALALRRWVAKGGRVLYLEPTGGSLPGFTEMLAGGASSPFVDRVVPAHPVFAGLAAEDFDCWSENRLGSVADRFVMPFNETMLAFRGRFLHQQAGGMALSEARYGKGRVLVSTFAAGRLAGVNGAATRYLRNLLGYLVATPERLLAEARPLPQRDTDEIRLPLVRERSWCLQLPVTGEAREERYHYARFLVSEQAVAAGASLRIGAKVSSLCFLHSAAEKTREGACCGRYRVVWQDGKSVEWPIMDGVQIAKTEAEIMPTEAMATTQAGESRRYLYVWHNLRPEVAVERVEVLAPEDDDDEFTLELRALTCDRAPDKPFVVLPDTDAAPPLANGADHGEESGPGQASWLKVKKKEAPLGKTHVLKLSFGQTVNQSVPWVILFFPEKYDSKANYQTVSFLYRSQSMGVVDMLFPEVNWTQQSSRTLNLRLADSHGQWVRARFHLDNDMKLVGKAFPRSALRSEILFFNGCDQEAGWPRPAAELEIADIRFE